MFDQINAALENIRYFFFKYLKILNFWTLMYVLLHSKYSNL